MMALRHRLTILTAATVGITVVLISVVAYVALRSELRGQVDDALYSQYQQVRATGRLHRAPGLRVPRPVRARRRAGGAGAGHHERRQRLHPARKATSTCPSTATTASSPPADAATVLRDTEPTACTCAC